MDTQNTWNNFAAFSQHLEPTLEKVISLWGRNHLSICADIYQDGNEEKDFKSDFVHQAKEDTSFPQHYLENLIYELTTNQLIMLIMMDMWHDYSDGTAVYLPHDLEFGIEPVAAKEVANA